MIRKDRIDVEKERVHIWDKVFEGVRDRRDLPSKKTGYSKYSIYNQSVFYIYYYCRVYDTRVPGICPLSISQRLSI